MIKVGITGQNGFIGSHLYNYLSLKTGKIKLIDFNSEYFSDEKVLIDFIKNCDVIIHLAGLNRHNNQNEILDVNLKLVDLLIEAISKINKNLHIIFSSSTQEKLNNPYGISKLKGRLKLANWAKKTGNGFTGLVIPNVYGPFGKPYYNSVISTFSYQLINEQEPIILEDREINLIYVQELCEVIFSILENHIGKIHEEYFVPHTYTIKVSEILKKLITFKEKYIKNSIIPLLSNDFELNLFNTFRSYIDYKNYFPRFLHLNKDHRGFFSELVKTENKGQFSYSITLPKVTRGNHFHTRKIERFIIISGKGKVRLRKYNTKEIFEFNFDGKNPAFIDIPIWYTHDLTNIGEEELITIFWINEFFDPKNPDTFLEEV